MNDNAVSQDCCGALIEFIDKCLNMVYQQEVIIREQAEMIVTLTEELRNLNAGRKK